MPGQPDVWNHVTLSSAARPAPQSPDREPHGSSTAGTSTANIDQAAASEASASTGSRAPVGSGAPRSPSRRTLRVGALTAALLLVGGSALATANAHKTITLDVDGRLTDITTFSGSVSGVLEAEGVVLGERDVVAPGAGEALREGDEIVVRHAQPLVVLADGVETTLWTTELSADAALASLESRGETVQLLASRSLATGRADLSVPLDLDGPVDVVADGVTHQVADGSAGLDEVMESLGITLGELDRLHVELVEPADATATASTASATSSDARLTVVVRRVVAQEQVTLTELPFTSVTEPSAELYRGETETAVAGVVGEQTTVHRVVLVDGVEESRRLLSDGVTRAPVTEVIHEGTKVRPVPVPRPAAAAATGGGGAVVTGDVWGALAQCESGGNPSIVSSNGLYHGLYQFSVGTWRSVGGSGLPSEASPAEQTQRAQALQARSGWGQWPHCSSKLGLR
ncbi:MAG: hypothetical protein JWP95_1761 [Actinotalea sp.]|nr:hypothetical protein [Actinotalea sp.]